MKTVNKTAMANLRQNRGRNIITGAAIALTSLLIFSVLTIGFGMIKLQKNAINAIYPTWQILYRNVEESTKQALKQHADIGELGERSDIGKVAGEAVDCYLLYLDEPGYHLNQLELMRGNYPLREDEIAVAENTLKTLGLQGDVGDYIELPYQTYGSEGLGVEKHGRFQISAILKGSEWSDQSKAYSIFVSKEFLENQVKEQVSTYRIMYRIKASEHMTTDEIETMGKEIASNFNIPEGNVVINTDYLWANYVDPSFTAGIFVIVAVVCFAGFMTIYSIYYISLVHKIQEYGKLKALGATRRQIRRIVFREGMLVASLAVPLGLLLGFVVSISCFQFFMGTVSETNALTKVMTDLMKANRLFLFQLWIVAAAILISLFTVVISLLLPMRKAGRISAIEAIRYENGVIKGRRNRRGYINLNLLRVVKANLSRNRTRTIVTIITMGITGVLFMVIATVLSCAKPSDIARQEILSDFRISIDSESGNAMHPERDWKNLQQNNPLNEDFEQQVLRLEGIQKIQKVQTVIIKLKDFLYGAEPWSDSIVGLGDEFAGQLEEGQTDGFVSYQELLQGHKIIVADSFIRNFPEVKIGDSLTLTIENGNKTIERQFEIGAIGDYPFSVTQGSWFLLPDTVIKELCDYNMTYSYEITAKKDFYKNVWNDLQLLIGGQENLKLESYREKVTLWEDTMSLMSKAGYTFMLILGGVGVMNLINTMINSVYTRKRELGIMQAIGLSDRQLIRMLQVEGMCYTVGTLFVALGLGNLAGYGVFLYAKATNALNITHYRYPLVQTLLLVIVVFLIQMLLSGLISKSFHKQSLIERIRFAE